MCRIVAFLARARPVCEAPGPHSRVWIHGSQELDAPRAAIGHGAPLSLARAGGGAIGLGASCGSTVGIAVDRLLNVEGIGERRLAHATQRLAACRSLTVLLVRGQVEGDEENQV